MQHLGAHLLGGSGSRGTRLRRSSDIDCLGCEGAACARSRRAMARAAIAASHAVGDLPDTIDLGLKGDGGKAEGTGQGGRIVSLQPLPLSSPLLSSPLLSSPLLSTGLVLLTREANKD